MEQIKDMIYELLEKAMSLEQLYHEMSSITKKELEKTLETMTNEGRIMKTKKGKYAKASAFGCILGTYSATERSFGFVLPMENKEEGDVFIAPKKEGQAWHGDEVLVKILSQSGGNRREGEIVRVIGRSTKEIIGTLEKKPAFYYLRPDSNRYPPIEVPKNKLEGANEGDKIAVRVSFYGDKKYMPQGFVCKILGESGTRAAAINAVLHANGIAEEFSPEAIAQAENAIIKPEDLEGRADLREKLIFTIDGSDSKDFDDAISLEDIGNGHVELGVHIADVSHYVTPGSPLDETAYERGTSVYFADKVIPMLPFALSNEICSLKPNEDRLAFSAFIVLTKGGKMQSYRFEKSIICSKFRLTYDGVNNLLEGNATDFPEQLQAKLLEMNQLAHSMRERRIARGALELDIKEFKVVCDEEGNPQDIKARTRGDSEKLIEEFMLAANEAAAELMVRAEFPAVYRVHENPDPLKLAVFQKFARLFGYKILKGHEDDTRELQKILDAAAGKEESRVLSSMLLRSLARARYSELCLGHFGLQSKFYLHFTSPIRRYPDLASHRMIEKLLKNGVFTEMDNEFCKNAALQASKREQAADTTARDIEKIYVAEYMERFVGEEFDGIITSILGFGFFVEVMDSVEGMVRLESVRSDYYVFDEEHLTLVGKNSGKRLTIGKKVRIKCIASNKMNGQIDFEFIE